jgi:hypothetical protein
VTGGDVDKGDRIQFWMEISFHGDGLLIS